MKEYVKKILSDGNMLIEKANIEKTELDEFERHIEYCMHERLVHLLVTLAFAIMTMMSLYVTMQFMQAGLFVLFVIFIVMTAAYAWHYYFLENSVQKMYLIADKLREKVTNKTN